MLNIVILAAGLGKRMQSDLPKVLHTLAGQPMLSHVLNCARQLSPARIVVVVGHGAEQVQATYLGQPDLYFVQQQPQLGTGHAVAQAIPLLCEDAAHDHDITLVLYGDVPLVRPETLQRLLAVRDQGVAVLTEQLTDPTGYGRILRDSQGNICRIVEQRDATATERAIREVNTGIVVAPTARLKDWLRRLDSCNSQREYYLTDIVGLAVQDHVPVRSVQPVATWETLGVNSRVQQAELERVWQLQQARRFLEAGVSLGDPARFDVRGTLHAGRDVFIDVGCLFENSVKLEDGVRIGPYCVLRDVEVGPGAVIAAYSYLEQTVIEAKACIGPYTCISAARR